jgi:hypothetical protein
LLHRTDLPDTTPNAPDPAPNFDVLGMVLKDLNETSFNIHYQGASTDFSHILFEGDGHGSEQLLSEAAKTESHLYDLATGSDGGEPSLRLVGLNNEVKGKAINPTCHPALGESDAKFNAVSADGSEAFFMLEVDGGCSVSQLFVRLGGARTLEVSRPLAASCDKLPCAGAAERKPATFRGASEDGSRVFFTSTQPLVPGETDTSNNLYVASIGCPENEPGCTPAERQLINVAQASRDPNGSEPAEVKDVVSIAPDGSHVYFVATGDLLEPTEVQRLAGEGRAVPHAGADNLYVYNGLTGKVAFVADLCSAPQLSGAVGDSSCAAGLTSGGSAINDTPLWTSIQPEAQVNTCTGSVNECTGDRETGRFLVFSSYAQLTAQDTDAAKDVYRYDAATNTLARVSSGENGYDANGNDSAHDATITISGALRANSLYEEREMGTRAISEDGSRIVFTTAEPLSAAAANGFADAYEWHEGVVALLSGATADGPVGHVLMSASGSDVFFTTVQGLVPQDTDGQEDVYDARLGEGLPAPSTPPQPCAGDACQGPLTNPAPLLVPGSVWQAPADNLPAAAPAPTVRPPVKLVRCKRGYVKRRGRCVKGHKARNQKRRGGR